MGASGPSQESPRPHGGRRLRSQIRAIRWLSQIGFLALFLFLVTGTVCAVVLGKNLAISEPLGVLQLVLASATFGPSLTLLGSGLIIGALIFVAVVFVLGRAFCAWACPLGTTIDAIDAALARIRFRPFLTRRDRNDRTNSNHGWALSNYGVLAAVLGWSALFKYPAWCALCPIGTICRGFAAGGELAIGAEFLAVPVAGALSLGEKRFWCRYLCPVGSFLTVLSTLNPFIKPRAKHDAEHRNCGACRRICPEGIDVCNEKHFERCTKCLECYVKCPYGSVTISLH